MKAGLFDSSTFGLGELITQKKLFRVPPHQRSYSWTSEAVSTFLSDIETAFTNKSAEYFVGLVVIQGPVDGEWVLLDGQQRLTTITLVYVAIRSWLEFNDLADDAKQIQNEFLGVRRLGGDYSSRLLLNFENSEVLDELVQRPASLRDLSDRARELPKRSSNRLMLESAIECTRWVDRIAQEAGNSKAVGAQQLFKLATYIETKIKVVSVEVSDEVDAFTLFESLNDRGLELSALDLIKNYTFSQVKVATDQLQFLWDRLLEQLEEANRDDFLKVFWTSRYGVIQKTHLFRSIRNRYAGEEKVLQLVEELRRDSYLLSAIDDAEHAFWAEFSNVVRDQIYVLDGLGSKQARPVVLSGLLHLSSETLAELLRCVVTTIVRYQIVGRGRTGVMEKVFGQLCVLMEQGQVATREDIRRFFSQSDLKVDDQKFYTEFAEHRETKPARYAYFLAAMELEQRRGAGLRSDSSTVQQILSTSGLVSIGSVIGPYGLGPFEEASMIGNFALVETEISELLLTNQHELSRSSFLSATTALPLPNRDDLPKYIRRRSYQLADIAAMTWPSVV